MTVLYYSRVNLRFSNAKRQVVVPITAVQYYSHNWCTIVVVIGYCDRCYC